MKKSIAGMLVAFSCMTCVIAHAQQQNPFSQFRIEHWDAKKGLPNELVLTMHQGKDGFLWLTSYSSLARFDGISFKSFTSRTVPLMKTDVFESALRETSDSTLWIPTANSGLLTYKNGQFRAFMTEYNDLRLAAMTTKEELILLSNKPGNPYIFFDTKSKKYSETTNTVREALYKRGNILSRSSVDKTGSQWIISNNNLVRIKGQKVDTIVSTQRAKSDTGLRTLAIRTNEVYVDKQDRVWLATENGLYFFKDGRMMLYPGMENSVFIKNAITANVLLEDRKGGLWAATNTGLSYLPPNSEKFIFAPEDNLLSTHNITNLLEDKEGNIWVSAQTGLYKLSYSKVVNYSEQDGLANNRVSAVCAIDSGNYLIGSAGKLTRVKQGLVEPLIFKNKLNANKVREVFQLHHDAKGTAWVCTNSYIIRISDKEEKLIEVTGDPRYMFEDANNKMWFGIAYKGIGFLNAKDEIEFLSLPQVDFRQLFISSIRKLKNENWLVTTFNKGALMIDKSGKPQYLNAISGISDVGVFSSYEDADGTVWLATQAGLTRYKQGSLTNIGTKDGMPENAIFDFLPDNQGYVWLPSNRGIVRAKKQELIDYLDRKNTKIDWKIFDDGDGMLNRQCVGARHGTATPDGKILIPTFGGLVEIDPENLMLNPTPPPVVIHTVLRDTNIVRLGEENTFEPGNHRYIFQYSALSLTAPEKVQIKFRLTGYDNDWISSVGDRKAYYTNIPSGEYTFQVIASNNDGVWNETGASFKFSIKPFFYETTWFLILAVLVLLLFIFIVVRWRTRVVRQQNEALEAQVAARTKDLNKANIDLNNSNAAIATQRDDLEKTVQELKSTQSQLIQSEKMASLGELTAGIAHEIQNPLNFVNNFSEVNNELIEELKSQKVNPEEQRELLNDIFLNNEKIAHHGKRADAIVKSMLQHSRSRSATKEPTDINKLADEYLRLAYHGLRAKDKTFNTELKTDYDESIGPINIIPQDIGRVILNLITNAFYAVNEKKKQQSLDYEPIVSLRTLKEGPKLKIIVRDNGNGIPQKILEKIFQPFFTTKPTGQGTGLGLSLSYDIVKAHGGELRVKTTEGKETTFIIELSF